VPLLDVDRQLIVVARVGDIDPVTCDPVQATTAGVTGLIMENIGRLWVMYEHKALVDPRLRDLYVMIAAQEIVILWRKRRPVGKPERPSSCSQNDARRVDERARPDGAVAVVTWRGFGWPDLDHRSNLGPNARRRFES
jgi:hypothetical protein